MDQETSSTVWDLLVEMRVSKTGLLKEFIFESLGLLNLCTLEMKVFRI